MKLYTTVYQIKKEKPNWNQVSPENISVKTLWGQYDRLKISNGMLYREWIGVTGIKNREICIQFVFILQK